MRKIYALVLMAAMLFVGANAWGTVHQVSGKPELLTAWYSAASGDEIKLMANIENFDTCLWLGTKTLDEASRQLTLDLNGHTMTGTKKHILFLTRGSLLIKTSVAGGTIRHSYERSTSPKRKDGDAIVVCGSALNTVDAKTATSGYFTYLRIDEGVTLDANGACNALTINALEAMTNAKDAKETTGDMVNYYIHTANQALASNAGSYKIAYHTNLWGTTADGLANGVRIEIAGTILAYQYGIKVNGTVRVPNWKDANGNVRAITTKYGNEFNGFSPDLEKTAFINLTPTGRIVVTSEPLTESATTKVGTEDKPRQAQAVYASGYARWLLEGYCGGNVGVYAKSGDIEIKDAVIESTSSVATNPTETGAGATAQGTAIIVQSTAAGSGEITVDITGDTEVSATSGYAIQESVTTPQGNQGGSYTSTVTVDGATINGGDAGAIAVTTKEGDTYVVTVETGSIQGNVVGQEEDQQGEGEPTTTPITLSDLIENIENTHTTTVYDENGQNPVVVVSPGKTIPVDRREANSVYEGLTSTPRKDTIKLKGTTDVISNTLHAFTYTFAELEMNEVDAENKPVAQTLTIKDNTTVTIGKVILGAKAKIIVEAGSKLLITGADGIYSRYASNLVLEANADKQATFVIGPTVTSNRQPYATVDLGTAAKKVTETNYLWQRFATPVLATTTPTKSEAIPTSVRYIDVESESWTDITSWNQLKVFAAAAITNSSTTGGVVYTFTGRLAGNVVDSIKLYNTKWNYYGNSYLAPMSIRHLYAVLNAQGVDPVVYIWNIEKQKYDAVNEIAYDMEDEENWMPDSIPALGFFVLRNRARNAGILNIDYTNSIYNYAVTPSNHRTAAPARQNPSRNALRINVQSLTGETDNVVVVESNIFSADYENGFDAEKLMNQGMNLFVADEQNLSILASDDVIGTQLTLQTVEDVNYTFTFSGVRGEHYALRDNLTGRVVEMVEGGQYTFSAQPNETIEGRFEIVGRQEMPTAMETIETENVAKAVYTILGQYVGDASNWDALPAGIYVVNGVKIVK